MSLVIRKDSNTPGKVICPKPFEKESELEQFLKDHYSDLLGIEETETARLVCQQFHLPEAGILDLLFVSSEGLPIVVEVKLHANIECRRKVVAQAIDYLSALRDLDFDHLNASTGNDLEEALDGLAGNDPDEFETLRRAVASNLRNGTARIVVAVDKAPAELVRIFRFLAENSSLDILLLLVERFSETEVGEVFVPHVLVDSAFDRKANPSIPKRTIEERLKACENAVAEKFFSDRLDKPRNAPGSALAYEEGSPLKKHWYVEPTRDGASVTQIGRFNGDEDIWRNLSSKKVTHQKAKDKNNLRFALQTPEDFKAFEDMVEKDSLPPREWKKP